MNEDTQVVILNLQYDALLEKHIVLAVGVPPH